MKKQLLLKPLLTLALVMICGSVWAVEYEDVVTVASGDVVSNSSYGDYTIDGWIVTFGGNNYSVGTNSGNRTKCTLSSYAKYAVSPVTTSDIATAFVSLKPFQNIEKISYSYNGGSNSGGN